MAVVHLYRSQRNGWQQQGFRVVLETLMCIFIVKLTYHSSIKKALDFAPVRKASNSSTCHCLEMYQNGRWYTPNMVLFIMIMFSTMLGLVQIVGDNISLFEDKRGFIVTYIMYQYAKYG